MGEYRYTANNGQITKVQHALKTCSYGIGFSELCEIEIVKGLQQSTIIFKTKDPEKELNPMEFFAFGIIIGREYLK